jgi:hypothetical protein
LESLSLSFLPVCGICGAQVVKPDTPIFSRIDLEAHKLNPRSFTEELSCGVSTP